MNDTYIAENEDHTFFLVNGNAESSNKWESYNSALNALTTDNNLQAESDKKDDPDYYHNNTQIDWIC